MTGPNNLPVATANDLTTVAGALSAPDTFRHTLRVLGEAIGQIDEGVHDLEGDTDNLARLYVIVARMRRDLTIVLDDAITGLLWDSMPDKTATVEGVGLVEKRHATSNTKWAHDDLWAHIRRVCTERAIDPETGEALLNPFELIDAVIGEARGMQSPGAWRKTALRERGIDPDEVSETNWGKRTVQITSSGGLA